jgi:hypothetical protein
MTFRRGIAFLLCLCIGAPPASPSGLKDTASHTEKITVISWDADRRFLTYRPERAEEPREAVVSVDWKDVSRFKAGASLEVELRTSSEGRDELIRVKGRRGRWVKILLGVTVILVALGLALGYSHAEAVS